MSNIDLHGTTDAVVWAEEFAKVMTLPKDEKWDLGFLIGWFANAIESGRYAGEKGSADKIRQAVKDEHDRGIAAIGYISAELASRSGAWDGDAPKWFPEPPEWIELWEEGYLHASIVESEDDGEE